ncbi:MAG TPA: pitrilysin family protein [Chitinophaga sp.]|uniref:M16 family metallopeptidase n=1 Tax=Chitinophaga sp. TaxID=1869181 RepID=UPI002C7E1714|nr:pitrilysin family protein [Chitinophaga sp.]HVI49331.1 pitrilysin family protein [Chitinophaga sp.]
MKMNFPLVSTLAALLLGFAGETNAQKIDFTEYDLDNGLHVILHQDKSAPVVAVSVMYHVGSKNENPERTGFAHFFEHLLFEGSDNIKRGEFMKLVSSNGGQNNANTSFDRTYYFETFPSNQLELGLWLESERMMHPVINEVGVNTQREVVKEEKRQRIDNRPYGQFINAVFSRIFTGTPYFWQPIGSMEHLNQAKLSEFVGFFKKFYVPNNAVLSISGDIDIAKTKSLVKDYFGDVPKGEPVSQPVVNVTPITQTIIDTTYDANIQLPAIITAYQMPGMTSKDARALDLLSGILSEGVSSRLYKKMVDDKKEALQVGAFTLSLESTGAYVLYALPNGNTSLNTLLADFDSEIKELRENLISEKDYEKLMNQAEDKFVGANTKNIGVAENLATAYTFFNKQTNHVNTELEEIKAVTREDIRNAARKYLNDNQRLILYYLPKK